MHKFKLSRRGASRELSHKSGEGIDDRLEEEGAFALEPLDELGVGGGEARESGMDGTPSLFEAIEQRCVLRRWGLEVREVEARLLGRSDEGVVMPWCRSDAEAMPKRR